MKHFADTLDHFEVHHDYSIFYPNYNLDRILSKLNIVSAL
jgi:hypothetical protein